MLANLVFLGKQHHANLSFSEGPCINNRGSQNENALRFFGEEANTALILFDLVQDSEFNRNLIDPFYIQNNQTCICFEKAMLKTKMPPRNTAGWSSEVGKTPKRHFL